MSAITEEYLRYGSGEISGYNAGSKVLSITPHSIMLPSNAPISGNTIFTGPVHITNTTISTSTITGAEIIDGGLGVNGAIYCLSFNVGGHDFAISTAAVNVTTAVNSAWTAGSNPLIGDVRKQGNIVTFTFAGQSDTADAAENKVVYLAAIPATYRPAALLYFSSQVQDSGIITSSSAKIDTNGDVTFFKTVSQAGNYTNGQMIGYYGGSFTYIV